MFLKQLSAVAVCLSSRDSYLGLDGITVMAPADTKAPVVTPPKDIHVEIAAREKSVPASHLDIIAFLNAATANDDRDDAVTARAVNPPASFPVGDTAVTFEAVDVAGNRGTATARVTVAQAPNRPPLAVDDSSGMRAGTAAEINVIANDSDPDGDALTAELVKPPAHGRAELGRDGTLRYTPESGFTGDDVLTYAVSDGQGGRAEATVRIAVADTPAKAESPKPADTPPPPPVEPVPPVTPTATVVKAPDGSVTWTFRGEIVEHEVDYHTFPANKDWLYVIEIGDGKNPAQWIRAEPGGLYVPPEDTSYAVKTRRRFALVPRETKDHRVQVWAAKGPYVLTVTGRADDHGNDWQHATPVALGQTVPGEIWEVPGNVDVFSFQGKKALSIASRRNSRRTRRGCCGCTTANVAVPPGRTRVVRSRLAVLRSAHRATIPIMFRCGVAPANTACASRNSSNLPLLHAAGNLHVQGFGTTISMFRSSPPLTSISLGDQFSLTLTLTR